MPTGLVAALVPSAGFGDSVTQWASLSPGGIVAAAVSGGRIRETRSYGVAVGVTDAAAPAASTLVALMTYVTVTVEPTFSSAEPFVVAGSMSNSNRSVPFSIVTLLPVASTTVPVI